MNASAIRRFLSRSPKRVCESATFELAFSHSRRHCKSTLHFFLTFPVFLDLLSCFRKALRELASPSDWAAAAAAPASAMASCFFSSISRARSAQDDRSQASTSEGRGGGGVKTNGLAKNLKLEADCSERQTGRFPWSPQCFCILFCMRSALATAWQPRACPLANPDSVRWSGLLMRSPVKEFRKNEKENETCSDLSLIW